MSVLDNNMAVVGQFSGGVVLGSSINTPALKASLADVLASFPFFAGRAYFADVSLDRVMKRSWRGEGGSGRPPVD